MDRYWVAYGGSGTGNWSDINHWSDVPGGAGGFSVPVATDNVYFTDNSLGGTVTLATTNYCKNLDTSALLNYNVILFANSGGYKDLFIHGSITVNSQLKFSSFNVGRLYLMSSISETITFNGCVFRSFIANGTGKWTLQDDFTLSMGSSSFTINSGELDLNSRTAYLGNIIMNGTSILTCGNATAYLTTQLTLNAATVTLNAGTSTFVLYDGSSIKSYSNHLFYNISVLGVAPSYTRQSPVLNLYGTHLVVTNNLIIQGYSSAAPILLLQQTWIGGSSAPTSVHYFVIANITVSYACFINIAFSGAANFDFSANTTVGDCGYNTGAIFITPITAYYHEGTGSYSNVKWFTETNGAGVSCRIPLAHDRAIFDSNSFDTDNCILTLDSVAVGAIDMSLVNRPVKIEFISGYVNISQPNYNTYMRGFGDFILSQFCSIFYRTSVCLQLLGYGRNISLQNNQLYKLDCKGKATDSYYYLSGFTGVYSITLSVSKHYMNNHTYYSQTIVECRNVYLMQSVFYCYGYGISFMTSNEGTSKIYIVPSSGVYDASIYMTTVYDLELGGNTTKYLVFNYNLNIKNNWTIQPGVKLKLFPYAPYNYKNYFKSLTLTGAAGNLALFRSATDGSQVWLEKTANGDTVVSYVDLKDIKLVSLYNIKNIKSIGLALVKKIETTLKASVKKVMGVTMLSQGIATNSTDSGNNSGWTITP